MHRIAQAGFAALTLTGISLLIALPAEALTMQECSAKYKAAQAAGSLSGMKWNDFRKAQCGTDSTAAPASGGPVPSPQAAQPGAAPMKAAPQTAVTRAAPIAPSTGNATFPTTVSSKFSTESAGKARMHTCLEQYNANKTANANGGMKWIEKGGGYYSECNKRLKG